MGVDDASLHVPLAGMPRRCEQRQRSVLGRNYRDLCAELLQEAAESAASADEKDHWRRLLHRYLHAVFQADASAAAEFHAMQVGSEQIQRCHHCSLFLWQAHAACNGGRHTATFLCECMYAFFPSFMVT